MTRPGKGQLPIPFTASNVTHLKDHAPSSRRAPITPKGMSLIYVLWITGKNWIKIGFTNDWKTRRKHYQRNYGKEGNGFHVMLLAHGTWEDEQHLHYGVLAPVTAVHNEEYYAPSLEVIETVHDLANDLLGLNNEIFWESDDFFSLLSQAKESYDRQIVDGFIARRLSHGE